MNQSAAQNGLPDFRNASDSGSLPLRRLVYGLFITIAVAAAVGRILGVGRVYEPWLFRPEGVLPEKKYLPRVKA